jgi:RNA polymerase sigma factor (sigma-70 family)
LGPDTPEDQLHEVFLVAYKAILDGLVRDPDRILGYIRKVVRIKVGLEIDAIAKGRRNLRIGEPADGKSFLPGCLSELVDSRHESIEQSLIDQERRDLADRVFRVLPRPDREILTRFYLQEQTQEEICSAMGITVSEYYVRKCRAKARFGGMVMSAYAKKKGRPQ